MDVISKLAGTVLVILMKMEARLEFLGKWVDV